MVDKKEIDCTQNERIGNIMIKFIASDLDGTILRNGAQSCDEELFPLVRELTKRGVMFAPASGRQYPNLRRLFAPVCDDLMYICENGALVMYRDEIIYEKPMERNLGIDIMKDIYNYEDCEILLSGRNTSYLMPKSKEYVHRMKNIVKNNVTIVDNIYEVEEEFLKISVYSPTDINKCKDYFLDKWQDKAKAVISGKLWLDFTDFEVNKGNAIKAIQNRFEIEKEECIAFGDNYNDLEMFEAVKESYAMITAVDDIKKQCTRITDRVETELSKILQQI